MNNVNLKGLKIGITGSTGVLGNKLTERLLSEGAIVYCLVRKTSNIERLKESMVTIVNGELTDKESLTEFISNIDVCVHLAALVSHATKKEYYSANVLGTENLCLAILEQNPKCKLVNCSSIAAYKMKDGLKLEYTDYAKSKYGADRKVEYYSKKHGLKSTTIYPGMIYGPGKNNFIPTLIENLKKEKIFFIKGGEKNAPLIYIDDLCDLFVKAIINRDSVGKKYIGIKNSNEGIHDFIRLLAKKTSYKEPKKVVSRRLMMSVAIASESIYSMLKIKKSPKISRRVVDVLSINFKLSIEQENNNLGWIAKTDMDEGLNKTLKWHLENKKNVLLQ